MSESPAPTPHGEIVDGAYCVLASLGEGGEGEVLRASRISDDQLVAVKRLHLERLSEPEARVRFGQPAIRGSLEPTLVRRVAQAHQAELLTCYQQALARTPEATGSVTVQYVITPPGTVGTATASDNDTGDGALGACIAQAVRRWTHPVSEGITAVRYSFQLTPHE